MRSPELAECGLFNRSVMPKSMSSPWPYSHNYNKDVAASTITSPFQQEGRGCSRQKGNCQYPKVQVLSGSFQKISVQVSLAIVLFQSHTWLKDGQRKEMQRHLLTSRHWPDTHSQELVFWRVSYFWSEMSPQNPCAKAWSPAHGAYQEGEKPLGSWA